MRSKALHIFSILLLTLGSVISAEAQGPVFPDGADQPKSKIKILGNVYGGGDQAAVQGNTTVEIKKGQYAGDIFGGGNGALNNDGTVKASADVGMHNDDGTLVDNTGATSVTINGGEIIFDNAHPSNHNIYGGGNLACNIAGSTDVKMTVGMVTWYTFLSNQEAVIPQWYDWYDQAMQPNLPKSPICAVFGAGYGKNTDVAGNTNVLVNIKGTTDMSLPEGDGIYAKLEEIDQIIMRWMPDHRLVGQFVSGVFGGGYDGTVGAYDADSYSANPEAPNNGINYSKDSYTSQTNVTIKGNPFLYNVFGGGLGSETGAAGDYLSHVGAIYGGSDVNIEGGIINGSVFGGGAGIRGTVHITSPITTDMPYVWAGQVFRETDVKISGEKTVVYGNVYGGGDIANTGWYSANARPKESHQANENHYKAKLDYTTSLHLNGGHILGKVFGGGNGRPVTEIEQYKFVGAVFGNTNVVVNGSTIWNDIYGGGKTGSVFSCKYIADTNNAEYRDVEGRKDGCTNVDIISGKVAQDIFGGGWGDETEVEGVLKVSSADVTNNTYVFFEDGKLEWSKYWKSREIADAGHMGSWTNPTGEVTGKFEDQKTVIVDGLYQDAESDINHNLYGGGNVACEIGGHAHIHMTSAPEVPASFATSDYYQQCVANVGKPHFSSFGGGFGVNAIVKGNTYSDIRLKAGSAFYSVIGGGMNGPVDGTCLVHVGADPRSIIHSVYGGGYYANCGGTDLHLTSGFIRTDVFGGSVMGNVGVSPLTQYATNTTIGLSSDNPSLTIKTEDNIGLDAINLVTTQNKITIGGNVYGANDVAGRVYGISDYTDAKITDFDGNPLKDASNNEILALGSANLTIYGGTINGDVFGAGNGDHIGYYEPNLCEYYYGKNEGNYYVVDHTGTDGPKGNTYTSRPQTESVKLTIEGNSTEQRVNILGQVFGGGNSCTIGNWDVNMLAAEGKYHGDPHLTRDDPAYFLGGGKLEVNLGSHIRIGRTHAQLAEDKDNDGKPDGANYLIDVDGKPENVSGLYMGCSGRDLATQNPSASKTENLYHHYYDATTHQYWPGFAVYQENTSTLLTRQQGLQSFLAYMNNILVWSDDVNLNIDKDADDIWISNFVGGGFRGSMKAKTKNGQFHYTLPRGVTIGHDVIGGAFNTDVVYRIFETTDGHTYSEENGHYKYLTTVGTLTQADEGNTTGDYHHIEYAADGTTPTGIVRFYYDGGMLSELPYGTNKNSNDRINRILKKYSTAIGMPVDRDVNKDFTGTGLTDNKAFNYYKRDALVYLELDNRLQVEYVDGHVHGGNVFGGCFSSGRVEGDIWTDYRCFQESQQANSEDFNLSDRSFNNAKNFEDNFAMMLFGAGYGANTNIQGSAYVRVLHPEKNPSAPIPGMAYGYPRLYNVFGGSYEGKVEGNTNIYFNPGKYGYVTGAIYGGGCNGYVGGKTYLELAGGYIDEAYGGARNANIGGGTHIWAYDGQTRWWGEDVIHSNGDPMAETDAEKAPLFIGKLYGGTDISGQICTDEAGNYDAEKGYQPFYSAEYWPKELTTTGTYDSDHPGDHLTFIDTYLQVGGVVQSDSGFPIIGAVYAAGNGEDTKSFFDAKYALTNRIEDQYSDARLPHQHSTLMEVSDGNIVYAFGGGNRATVTDQNYIMVRSELGGKHDIEDLGVQMYDVMKKRVLSVGVDCYDEKLDENSKKVLDLKNASIQRLFGGNNIATMDIQPKWQLISGRINNVYSGGNMGDMTYYNPEGKPATETGSIGGTAGAIAADGSNSNYTPRGLSITIEHPEIHIGSLYGGCRLSDVNPTPKGDQPAWPTGTEGEDFYGATVNITDGYIENVYGGNDISGTVHHGTNVNISGAVSGNVYGSGNGFYLYKWDENAAQITEHLLKEYDSTLPDDDKSLCYTVPASAIHNGTSANNTEKLLTINDARPSVEKAFLNIAGLEHYPTSNAAAPKRVAYVKGNVFCGGNASTIIGDGSFSKFKIGSYVTLNGVFMGSDGYAFTQNDQIAAFAKLNGFTDMGEATVASSFLNADDAPHNPILLNVYMMAVDMKAHPKDFNLNLPLKEAHIGTYCGGGNRGSMLVNKMVSLPFHHDIIIYDKIVGACLDANIKYNQNGTIIRSDGGYSRAVDVEHNGEHGEYGNTKIRLDIASQFVPLKMDVPADKLEKTKNKHGENFAQAAAHDFLYDNRTEEVKYTFEEFNTLFETEYTSQAEFEAKESNDHIWKEAPTDAYAASCNIYGGCYESGEVEGDIIINLHSNMLRYVNEETLKKSVDYNIACFNVYGAGFGQDSHVWGNVNINMDRSLNTETMGDIIAVSTLSTSLRDELTSVGAFDILDGYLNANLDNNNFNRSYPSANNIIGGGRNGKLIGNTTLEIRNGLVYTDVAGGCYASDMYGSTHVIVGYPKYYKCLNSNQYFLDRADKWNTQKLDGDGYKVVKDSIWYLKGDLVPENIYQQIVTHTAGNAIHFEEVIVTPRTNHASDATSWNDVHIKIGKGVYGGGYSLENSMAASAGSITTHKLKDDNIDLHPHNFNGRYGLDIASTVGYGGNSSIMVGDMDKTLAENSSYTERDHIHISTLNATEANIPAASSVIGKFVLEDGKYTHQGDHTPEAGVTYYTLTGDGGIYGDGHLTFCDGFRSADVTRYGWAEGTPKHPVLLNTFQRMDLLSVNDCCLMLQGAQDFATDQIDATIYSITRINELRMNSSLNASANLTPISPYTGANEVEGFRTKQMRNYLAFFNNVHYLGSIVTNDPFDGRFHRKDGTIVNNSDSTYIATKQKFIDDYTSSTPDSEGNKTPEATNIFKQRNVATARNAIGINNGYCLRVLNQEYDFTGDVKVPKTYYGPIVGVCEVKLLTLVQGEGGGYVYADNIHKEYTAKDGHHNENDYFLMTSGNFVFPGIIQQGKDEHGNDIGDQFIVDDCFLEHFGTPGKITTKLRATGADLDEAHYWYVEGNKYFFTTTLTGFTYQKDLIFNLTKTDPNIILSGLGSGAQLNVKKIEWLSTEDGFHRANYEPVLPSTAKETDDEGNEIDKISDYEFDIEIGGYDTDDWKWDMPRHTDLSGTTGKTLQNNHLPQFNIKLQDKLDNSGDEAYNNHLDEPELVKIYLQGEYNGQIYEYTITVNIVYLQGPTVNGFVKINNCALPGEWIRFSTDGLVIKTPELMPVTSASWQILPLKQINSDGSMEWDMEHGIVIDPSRYGEITGTKDVEGTIRALYKQNEYNIAYIFTAGGYDFPVMPAQNIEMEKEERMIVVHNYHRMKDVVPQELQIETMPSVPDYRTEPASHHSLAEAKIYIEDEADLRAFVEYLNMATTDNTKNIPVGLTGLDFILQKDIKLTSDLPAITQSFAGNFHGDGYHIDLGEFGSTLFGDNLEGKVYNLGLVNGENIASTGSVVNSYVYDASDDNFKYGKMAYQLSHAFNPTTDASTYESYVATRYANGDYQYAADNRPWSLRTGAPNYGNDDTRHNTEHTHDEDRWDNTSETNVPLYDGTRVVNDVNKTVGVNVVTFKGLPVAYANDYLFFGQHLDKTSADAYPMHIEDVATGDADRSKGGNRVYETAGYYHSKVNDGYYYNMDAWALQPTLTAIDYTKMTEEGDDAVTLPAKFSVDSNKDYDANGDPIATYTNEGYGHVSQNLLVYNAGEAVFDQKEVDDIAENAVTYHNLVNNGSNFATDYFHLVDKQCFNAPIAFNVAKRAWYERMPERWRNVTGTESYDSPSAWEGICLPFTARKVSAVENGELSHFYGTGDQTETIDGNTYNINTLHHEYWLTGFTKMEGDATAVFSRPSVEGDGLFVNEKQKAEAEKIEYTYPANKYFTSLVNYTDYHDKNFDESDKEGDEWIRSDAEWYLSSHQYKDYVPLTASVPYLIAFPGNDFYEFSLEGQTADDKKLGDGHKKSGDPQLVTFENKVLDSESPIQINVSDTEIAGNKSYVNDYYHVGTYMRVVSDDEKAYIYGVNSTGSAFTPESDTTPVLPFRTYMTRSENAPQTRAILISDGYITEIGEEAHPEDELGEDYLKIWGEGRDIVVETSKIRSFNLFGLNGAFLGKLECKPGVNRFTQEVEGIYLVGKTKVLLK